MTPEEQDAIRQRCLARVELASDMLRDLEAVQVMAIRGAKQSGATWRELQIASGLTPGKLRRVARR